MRAAIVPTAKYRLQFDPSFTFAAATAIVDSLDTLGISHGYASSYFKAVPGSTQGCDVADPTQLNPEIGDHDTFDRWVNTLRARGMGHIIDLVPNHIGIAHSSNPWWQDAPENGPSSGYAQFFDTDWHPLRPELEDRVLLPIIIAAFPVYRTMVVPRLVATLKPDGQAPVGDAWDTRICVTESAPRCYKQLFTGRSVPAIDDAGRTWNQATDVFEAFPIGFLEAA